MEMEIEPRRPDTFVVQLASGSPGQLAGLIHHVRTGEKRRFEGLVDLGEAIRGMTRREATPRAEGAP